MKRPDRTAPRTQGPEPDEARDPGTPGGFVVGVDGGGTGSRAQIMDLEGKALATAEGPPALVDPSDPGVAAGAIAQTVRDAVEAARMTPPARALWAGLAGAGRSGAREAVEIALRSLKLAERVRVGMDVEGAHWDAFRDGPGILLVLGTGSMLWGRDPEGMEIRVGGWGSILGDEGSGYWIGLQGLRAVARAHDGRGPATLLTPAILEASHLPDPPSLIPWAASASKAEIGALAPLVLAVSVLGDPPAEAIIDDALGHLRRHFRVVQTAWEPWGPPLPVAVVGGLVEEKGPILDRVSILVREIGGQLHEGPVRPVRGAARKALELFYGV